METFEKDKNEERRKRVFVGRLPHDFLRLTTEPRTPQEQQEAADAQAALALQQQLVGVPYTPAAAGRLNITVAQAKLVRNYGMTRMDPYVRLRVGHCIYETHTDPNGGKNPKWNRVVQCALPKGVNTIYLELFDECSFTMDELIAWAAIPIPPGVTTGDTVDDWYPLSGKQGEGLEGMINLVISYQTGPYGLYPPVGVSPMMVGLPSATYLNPVPRAIPVQYAPPPLQTVHPIAPHTIHLSVEGLKQIQEMFPNIDPDVIKTIYEGNQGNKDLTVNSVLKLCN